MTNVCKGDLAQVVKAGGGFKWTLGRVVRIAGACGCAAPDGPAYWRFEEALLEDGRHPVQCCADNCLKRIPPLDEPDVIDVPTRRLDEEHA